MNSGYRKENKSVPGTGSGNRSVMVPVMGISPLFIRGIPNSGNRTAPSGIPAPLGLWEKGNSGNHPACHQLRTLAAVIILTVRRITRPNGNSPPWPSHPFPALCRSKTELHYQKRVAPEALLVSCLLATSAYGRKTIRY